MTLSSLRSNSLLPQSVFPVATVTTTTGTPNTGSISADSNGFTWSYWRWTGSGSVTIGTAGYADLLVCGGGGGGRTNTSNAGGGAGGLRWGSFWLPVATYTITIGGAGAANQFGTASAFGTLLQAGGGMPGFAHSGTPNDGLTTVGGGGSMGGVTYGSLGNRNGAGAGGLLYGANDYSGVTLNFDNSSVEYARGGYSGSTATANRGYGGAFGAAGSAGVVIMKIRTN